MGSAHSDLRNEESARAGGLFPLVVPQAAAGGGGSSAVIKHHIRRGPSSNTVGRLTGVGPGNSTLLDSPLDSLVATPQRQGFPTVVRYQSEASNVSVVGSFNSWKPLTMTKSGEDYFIILTLPRGTHTYHFLVDNEPKTDATQKTVNQGGTIYNVLNIAEGGNMSMELEEDALAPWGQTRTIFEETKKSPPLLPPHLRYTPLNSVPSASQSGSQQISQDSTDLNQPAPVAAVPPLPLHVTVNHVYFQRQPTHIRMGLTIRVKAKFTNIFYYTSPNAEPLSPFLNKS